MKTTKLLFLLISLLLTSCISQPISKYSFGNSISYEFELKTKEIKKSGDFLLLIGENKEKIVISENYLDDVLNQISPTIDAMKFFDLVYQNRDNQVKTPTQVLDFRNGLLDEKIVKKFTKNKTNSIIYLWELTENRFKAIEVKKGSTYFLNIYVENYNKDIFLTE